MKSSNGGGRGGSDSKPFVRCPSAMECVQKTRCDFDGFITEEVFNLTPDLEMLRVPLIVRIVKPCLFSDPFFPSSLVSIGLEITPLTCAAETQTTRIPGLVTLETDTPVTVEEQTLSLSLSSREGTTETKT